MKILIFLILTSYFTPQLAISSTLDEARFEIKMKRWQLISEMKEANESIMRLRQRISELKEADGMQSPQNSFSKGEKVRFKECQRERIDVSDMPYLVEVCLNVTSVKIDCHKNVYLEHYYQCKITIDYFSSRTIPRPNSLTTLDFDGYVELDYISNGSERSKRVEVGLLHTIVGSNQFNKFKGFRELNVFFDRSLKVTEVNVAKILLNIKSTETIDKPNSLLGISD